MKRHLLVTEHTGKEPGMNLFAANILFLYRRINRDLGGTLRQGRVREIGTRNIQFQRDRAMTTNTDRRLAAARRALVHIREALGLDVAFELWDGSRIPDDTGAETLRIAFTDPSVFPRLLRRPRIPTLIDLYADGRIDVRGGTLFDLAERRPAVRTREFVKPAR